MLPDEVNRCNAKKGRGFAKAKYIRVKIKTKNMDTGNIMENQLQDQIDAYDSEEKIQYEIEKAIAKDEAIELLLDAKKAIFEKAPVKYVQKGSELKRVFEQEVENTLFYIDEMIDSRIESIKGTITF